MNLPQGEHYCHPSMLEMLEKAGIKAYEKDGKRFISVDGTEIEVKSNEECAAAEFRLCKLVEEGPSAYQGSLQGPCCGCGKLLWYDPKIPKGPEQQLICMPCAMKQGEQESFAV